MDYKPVIPLVKLPFIISPFRPFPLTKVTKAKHMASAVTRGFVLFPTVTVNKNLASMETNPLKGDIYIFCVVVVVVFPCQIWRETVDLRSFLSF